MDKVVIEEQKVPVVRPGRVGGGRSRVEAELKMKLRFSLGGWTGS